MKSTIRLTAAALLVVAMAGCQDSGVSRQGTAPQSEAAIVPELELLSLTEVQGKIALNADQTTRMTAALDRWRQSAEMHVLDRAMGKGRGPWLDGSGEPPVHEFLKESATFLRTEDMVTLVGLVAEKRQAGFRQFKANRDQTRKGEGLRRAGKGRGEARNPHWEDLNLTEEQKQALADLRAELRDQFPPGERRVNVREAIHERMKELLTGEQMATLESRRTERRAEMAERMREHFAQAADRRIDFLATVLKLTEDQKSRIEHIWQQRADEHESLRQSLADKSGERGARRDKMQSLHQETATAVREILTPEQARLFDALEELHPMMHRGRLHRNG